MEWFGEKKKTEKKNLVFSFLQVATLQFRGKLDGSSPANSGPLIL